MLFALLTMTLGGCGIIPALVGDTTQAVLTPMSNLAQEASYGLSTVDHSVTTMAQTVSANSTQMARTVNATSANVSNAAYTTGDTTSAYQTATYSPPPLTSDQKAAINKGKTAEQPDLPILPDETLAKLTKDQKGLQNAAQKAALTAPVGETIFWNLDNRSGTVVAKDEHKMGETLCRSFEQSVTIDGVDQKGHGIACRDDTTGHWSLAF
ncbi:MAG: hypothetical protein EPO08_08110 [Rhodospirillaceae bacterium]|nr:MAG: hypothetical protein EPO08_08110 [Rhodospirillaceae bacterium]